MVKGEAYMAADYISSKKTTTTKKQMYWGYTHVLILRSQNTQKALGKNYVYGV